jgi:hypothetical protein
LNQSGSSAPKPGAEPKPETGSTKNSTGGSF